MLIIMRHQNNINYGKIIPYRFIGLQLYKNPQYYMFFITLLLTFLTCFLMLNNVFILGCHRYIALALCIYILYLLVFLGYSNPGFAFEAYNHDRLRFSQPAHSFSLQNLYAETEGPAGDYISNGQNIRQQQCIENSQQLNRIYNKYCSHCHIPVSEYSHHCKFCEVCIDSYDHHCIWIGKCIGKKNVGKFRQFILFIFGTLIYAIFIAVQNAKLAQSVK